MSRGKEVSLCVSYHRARAEYLPALHRDVKLLSFGGDEEAEEEAVVFKKRPIVRPDRK